VILALALFRLMAVTGIARDFTILENNCTQSIAPAAGYVNVPLTAGFAAYMMMTGRVIAWWQRVVWMIVVSLIGVRVAFPMKRRFINEDQLPFPEGRLRRRAGLAVHRRRRGGRVQGAAAWHDGGDHPRRGDRWSAMAGPT